VFYLVVACLQGMGVRLSHLALDLPEKVRAGLQQQSPARF